MEQKVFVGIAACGCIHAAWIDRADDDQSDMVAEMIRSGLRVVYRPLGDGVRLNGNCGHHGIASTTAPDEALRKENTRLTLERDAAYEALLDIFHLASSLTVQSRLSAAEPGSQIQQRIADVFGLEELGRRVDARAADADLQALKEK